MQNQHTGLFINFNKSNMLLRFVRSFLQHDFKYLVTCGPKNAHNACELILQNLSDKSDSDFDGAKDLLIKYIDILECCSVKHTISSTSVNDNESSIMSSVCRKQTNLEKSNKPLEAAVGKMPNFEVIDLEMEDTDCNKPVDVIELDSSQIDSQESKQLNNCSLYFVDKACPNFESSSSHSKKEKDTKSISKKKKKIKESTESENCKNVLKEPNSQNCFFVNLVNSSVILESESEETEALQNITPKFNTIDLIDECSDDDVVLVDEKLDNEIIVLDSPGPQNLNVLATPPNQNFSIKTVRSLKKLNSKERKAHKCMRKYKTMLRKYKQLTAATTKRKSTLNEWTRPAHLSPTLTKKPKGVRCKNIASESSTGSPCVSVGSNIYNPNGKTENKKGLRPIIIDGSNIAVRHGKGIFSMRGLHICIEYFLKRGHKHIKVFVPQYRVNASNFNEIDRMERSGLLILTPSRRIEGRLVAPYDDRFIIQYAAETNGIVVSSDNFRDLYSENPAWKETIERRLLMFTWVDDVLMFPQDPLGRNGPTLDEFLKY